MEVEESKPEKEQEPQKKKKREYKAEVALGARPKQATQIAGATQRDVDMEPQEAVNAWIEKSNEYYPTKLPYEKQDHTKIEDQSEQKISEIIFSEKAKQNLVFCQMPKSFNFKQQLSELRTNETLGKMRVHKSGKVTMLINGIEYNLDAGVQQNFAQEVAVIEENNINFLGYCKDKVVMTPNINGLI